MKRSYGGTFKEDDYGIKLENLSSSHMMNSGIKGTPQGTSGVRVKIEVKEEKKKLEKEGPGHGMIRIYLKSPQRNLTLTVPQSIRSGGSRDLKLEFIRTIDFKKIGNQIVLPTSGSILGSFDSESLARPSSIRAEKAANNLAAFWKSDAGSKVKDKLYTDELVKRSNACFIERAKREACEQHVGSDLKVALESVPAQARLQVSMDILETSRFLVLKFAHSDMQDPAIDENGSNVGCVFSPAPRIDRVWSLIILNPRAYMTLCFSVLGMGGLLGYSAECTSEHEEQCKKSRYSDTWKAYNQLFGCPPLLEGFIGVWPKPIFSEVTHSCGAFGDDYVSIKQLIQETQGLVPERYRLIFDGREIEDHQTLCEAGVTNESTIQMVITKHRC